MLERREKYTGFPDLIWIFQCQDTCTKQRNWTPPPKMCSNEHRGGREWTTNKKASGVFINAELYTRCSIQLPQHVCLAHPVYLRLHTDLADITQNPCETLIFLQQQVEAKHLSYSIIKGIKHLSLAVCNTQGQNNVISITKKPPQVVSNLQFC